MMVEQQNIPLVVHWSGLQNEVLVPGRDLMDQSSVKDNPSQQEPFSSL